MAVVTQVFDTILVIAIAIAGVVGYFTFEYWRHKHLMRRAEHEKERASLEFRRVKTQALQVAVMHGVNYEVGPDDTLKVTHIFAPPASSYKINMEQEEPKQIAPPALPGPCDFADLLETWRPSAQQIMLALAPGGQPILVPLKALCHVALAGATNNGKSVLMRLLLSQLLYVNTHVILADPHFAPVDPESGEDWRPIANRLVMEPAVSYPAIKDTLQWLASDELPKRLERRRLSEQVGTPYFLAMDELPAIIKHVPEAPEYMADLLREGRKVGLYLVCAAQDWLVKTVGGSGAVRDCFRTAFYVGGDTTSARVLLDVKGRVDDGGLGRGIVMMRSYATPQAALSRIPYASNDALYDLLTGSPASSPATGPLQSRFTDAVVEASTTDPLQPALDARSMHVREMLRSGMSQRQIIQDLYGVTGGAKYTEAAKELAAIIAKLL